jgi:acetylornithine/N-succinyldiaminopimelate aminotransferase
MGQAEQTDTTQQDHSSLLHIYNRPDCVFERGEGVYLFDTTGRRYLDFVAGIAVNALGHGDPDVLQAMSEQASQLIHVSNLYYTQPGSALARELVATSPHFDKVYFGNSGTEAIEAALKFARKVARSRHGEGKTTVVACEGSFHGRTMGAVAITAREQYRLPFMPVMPDVRFTPFNDVAALDQAITADVCAVVVEPVQGEGGLKVASVAFLQRIRELCDQHDALLILDEIQCGMGRTGTLWAHSAADLRPDMMAIAKPLAGGLPIGALLLNQHVASHIQPGDHGTTFGGGPFITAAARVVLRRISDPQFLDHVRSVSDYFAEALHDFAASRPGRVRELRGVGLMRGLQIDGSAADVRQRAHDQGLLVATAGPDVIRLLPPLIVEPQHIDEALTKLGEVF